MFYGQLPKVHGNIGSVVYINISTSCSSVKKMCALRCGGAGCDGHTTCTSMITHRTLHGTTKKHYKAEDRSRHSCFLLWWSTRQYMSHHNGPRDCGHTLNDGLQTMSSDVAIARLDLTTFYFYLSKITNTKLPHLVMYHFIDQNMFMQ